MHIAYLDPHPVPGQTVESLQILQTVDALGSLQGVSVLLITPAARPRLSADKLLGRPLASGVKLVHLTDLRKRWFLPSSSNRPFLWMALRRLRGLSADALLVRNIKLAEYLLRQPGLPPLFFETHEVFAQTFREDHPDPTGVAARKLGALERREALVYGKAAGLIALTQSLIDDVRRHYRVATPALVAPDGVDLQFAGQVKKSHVPNHPPVLLYLGSLHPWKGVDVLVEAMHWLPEARLHIVGGDRRRIDALCALATRIGVQDRVRFLGPAAPVKRFEVIAAADICVLPSSDTSIGGRYTSPMKLFEYMAMGKPIVAADLPAMREVLRHGQNALLAEVGNPRAFADAAKRLLGDALLAQSLGEAARRDSMTYAWTERASRITSFMTHVMTTLRQQTISAAL